MGGAALTILAGIAAASNTAISGDAFDGLGVWSSAVAAGLKTLAAASAPYAKLYLARRPNPLQETNAGIYTDLVDLSGKDTQNTEGKFASSQVSAEIPEGHAADESDDSRAAETASVVADLEAQLRTQERQA